MQWTKCRNNDKISLVLSVLKLLVKFNQIFCLLFHSSLFCLNIDQIYSLFSMSLSLHITETITASIYTNIHPSITFLSIIRTWSFSFRCLLECMLPHLSFSNKTSKEKKVFRWYHLCAGVQWRHETRHTTWNLNFKFLLEIFAINYFVAWDFITQLKSYSSY